MPLPVEGHPHVHINAGKAAVLEHEPHPPRRRAGAFEVDRKYVAVIIDVTYHIFGMHPYRRVSGAQIESKMQ